MWNKIGSFACVAVALLSAPVARADNKATPAPPNKTATAPPTAAETRDEINRAVGFTPQFIKALPDAFVATFWSGLMFQMNPNTSLDAKSKELIGLAVASQIPCEYCVYFHTVAARHAGASEQDIKEAVAEAAMTRMGSTMLNGLEIDKVQFKKDVDRMMKNEAKQKVQAGNP